MKAPSAARARLAILGAAALFSTGGAAIKATTLSSWQVAGLRSLVASAAILVLLPEARRGFGRRALAVGCGHALTLVLFVTANKLTTSANTIFLQSTAPLYVLLAGPWLLREPIRRSDLGFLAVAGAGLACFFLGVEPATTTAPDPVRGNWVALLSGVTWALTIVGLRWLGTRPGARHAEPAAAVVLGNLIAFALCAPAALPLRATAADWLIVGYLGVFQIGAAYALMTRGLRGVTALTASLLLLMEPVLNPVWALIVHREVPGPWALVGAVLVLGGTVGKSVFDGFDRQRATVS